MPMELTRQKQAGFTLIEVMVVVFIIGLMSASVVFAMPRGASAVKKDSAHFAVFLQKANDEAVISGLPLGLMLEDGRYELVAWTGNAWRSVGEAEQLDERVSLELVTGSTTEPDTKRPVMVFDPTGVTDARRFRFQNGSEQMDVVFTEGGDVETEAQ